MEAAVAIDILINSASLGTFDMNPAEWEQIVQVSLFGTYYATRAVLLSMIARETGNISIYLFCC